MFKASCTVLLSALAVAAENICDESLDCGFSALQHKVKSTSYRATSTGNLERAVPASEEVLTGMVQDAIAMMEQDPDEACRQILKLQHSSYEPGQVGAFGAPKARFEILEAGIGGAAAQGLLKSLAAETVRGASPKGEACFQAIARSGVQYDHERSVAHYANSPHLWDALVAWNNRIMNDHNRLRQGIVTFAGVYGIPPHEQALTDMGKAGGFDQMINVLKNNMSDLLVAQAAWAGLSDNVENFRTGAELAANNGGTSKGLETLIDIIKQYRGKHAYQPGMYFGLRYESIHDINGILMFDDAKKTWTDAALKAGFMDEALLAMAEEPDDHLTTSNGCEAISHMAQFSAETREKLVASGAIKLAAQGLVKHHNPPALNTMVYHILNTCSTAIISLAAEPFVERPRKLDSLLDAGVLSALHSSMPVWTLLPADSSPRGSFFPWTNVEILRSALENRQQSLA